MGKYFVFGIVLFLFLLQCDGSSDPVDCSTMTKSGLELISPKGTEIFTMGSKVPVKWKVDPDKVSSVGVMVCTGAPDGQGRNVFSASIAVPIEGGIQCMDTVWTIGEEYAAVGYTPPQTVYLRIEKYNAAREYNDVTGLITINE